MCYPPKTAKGPFPHLQLGKPASANTLLIFKSTRLKPFKRTEPPFVGPAVAPYTFGLMRRGRLYSREERDL